MNLVKVIEVDQWTSTASIKHLKFDDAVLMAMRGGDADTAKDFEVASLKRMAVLESAEPAKSKVWFRRGSKGELVFWKANYDTSD